MIYRSQSHIPPTYIDQTIVFIFSIIAPEGSVVHNHPSGDPTPSRADIEMTKQIRDAIKAVGISLHDHFVIGRRRHANFKSLGLI